MWLWSSGRKKEKEANNRTLARIAEMSKSFMFSRTPRSDRETANSGNTDYFMTQKKFESQQNESKTSVDLPPFNARKVSSSEVLPSSRSTSSGRTPSSSRVAVSLPNINEPQVSKGSPPFSRATSVIPSRPEGGGNLERVSAKPSKVGTTSSSGTLCCDKCDGKHETDNCPHYKKSRESHPDAQKNFYKKIGGTSNLPGAVYRSARVVRQPGDGSCLFHSISYGLRDGSRASTLRGEICSFIAQNPSFKISETPLSDWVKWDSGVSAGDYARKMSRGSWGGGIEMAVASQIKGVNVHVYEQSASGYKRISAFDHPSSPESRRTVRVLYRGGVHYDALVVD